MDSIQILVLDLKTTTSPHPSLIKLFIIDSTLFKFNEYYDITLIICSVIQNGLNCRKSVQEILADIHRIND